MNIAEMKVISTGFSLNDLTNLVGSLPQWSSNIHSSFLREEQFDEILLILIKLPEGHNNWLMHSIVPLSYVDSFMDHAGSLIAEGTWNFSGMTKAAAKKLIKSQLSCPISLTNCTMIFGEVPALELVLSGEDRVTGHFDDRELLECATDVFSKVSDQSYVLYSYEAEVRLFVDLVDSVALRAMVALAMSLTSEPLYSPVSPTIVSRLNCISYSKASSARSHHLGTLDSFEECVLSY